MAEVNETEVMVQEMESNNSFRMNEKIHTIHRGETLEGDTQKIFLLSSETQNNQTKNPIFYKVDDSPNWMLSILLAFQHYLTMFLGAVVIPFIFAYIMCFDDQPVVLSEVMGTLLFIYGISTFVQVSLGVRLPVVQGGSFAYVGPIFAILDLPMYQCSSAASNGNHTVADLNSVFNTSNISSSTVRPVQDPNDWKMRMNVICGSLMAASVFQVFLGFSGIIGRLLKLIGPLTIGSVLCLIGIHLYPLAVENAGKNWIISGTTLTLILVFTLYLSEVSVPIPWCGKRKEFQVHWFEFHVHWFKVFKLFPLVLAMLFSWSLCGILTGANVLSSNPKHAGYWARTDRYAEVIKNTKWIRVPYPGQWGMPTVTIAGTFGLLAAVMTSVVESVGGFYACAKVAGAPPPPKHAINRGVGITGIAGILSGGLGGGLGLVPYSQNIAVISMTKAASRRVMLCAAVIMIVSGIIGKFSAVVSTIPAPVIGGAFIVLFGMIAAIGIGNLQLADMKSSRNVVIVGVSLLSGMGIPHWLKTNVSSIKTGVSELDQIIRVLLTTEIAVGGLVAFILDNTAPGTEKERGLLGCHGVSANDLRDERTSGENDIYDLPRLLQRVINKCGIARFIPFLPYHKEGDMSPSNDQACSTSSV